MPKFYKKKRTMRKSAKLPFTSRKVDFKQNKVIKNLSKRINKINKSIELKQLQNYQSSYNNTPVTTTLSYALPWFFLLNSSIQGNSIVTRIGDKIRMTSVQITGQVYPTGGGATLGFNVPVRIIIFTSKNPKGITPYISLSGSAAGQAALFYNTGGLYPSTYQMYDTGVNQAMYENYGILFDKTYSLRSLIGAYVPSTDAPNSVNPYFNFNIRKKLNLIADFSRSNTNTILDMERNAIFALFITDSSANLTVEMDSRVYFKDA